jgi:hypothetical protein
MLKVPYPVFYLCDHVWPLEDWNISGTNTENLQQIWTEKQPVDLLSVLASKFKIAVLPVFCNVPGDSSYNTVMDLVDLGQFDLVLLSSVEFQSLSTIQDWIKQSNIKNYLLSTGSLHNNEFLNVEQMVYRPWWAYLLITMHRNSFVDTSGNSKPYAFDALLGRRRYHRDFVINSFESAHLLESNLITYRQNFMHNTPHLKNINLFPYVSPHLDPSWDVEVPTDAYQMPWEIYRRTNYSVVCETIHDQEIFFMTEKTAKPIWAKRLFVMFSTPGFLKRLHELGFKTFDHVIDESYDNVSNAQQRFVQAFEQVKWLTHQDPEKIQQRIQSVVQHNHDHLSKLIQQTQQTMCELLQPQLNSPC